MLPLLTTLVYYLCLAITGALACLIFLKSRDTAHAPLRRIFFLLILCLLLWQLTLFLASSTPRPEMQLYLGRLNFATIAVAVYLTLRFVQSVAQQKLTKKVRRVFFLETVTLTGLTIFTPLISVAESLEVGTGNLKTEFGFLFPLYVMHLIAYLFAALTVSLRARQWTKSATIRKQLLLIGGGILATSGVAFITNLVLPYGFDNFTLCSIGTLAVLLFALAIAYAVFVHQLFDVRVIVRTTLVYGILLAFVLGTYSSTVFLITQYLTEGADRITQFSVLLIAFSIDPLRRFLEKKTDRLLFNKESDD